MKNRKATKNYTNFFLLKFISIIFSLILLLFVLSQLIKSLDGFFGPNDEIKLGITLVSVLIAVILLLSIFEVLSLKEYRGYFIRKPFIQNGRSYLTLEDIFENENRVKIIKQILKNPGIHQNELLRSCKLQKGQLQWHLDVLLKHKIINKVKEGQYNLYFSILSSIDTIENLTNGISKSETTIKVLNIIQKNPGISASEISELLSLARNSVKYHVDKLSSQKLISLEKEGRKIGLFPV